MTVPAIYRLCGRNVWERSHLADVDEPDLLAQLCVRKEAWHSTSGDANHRPGRSVLKCAGKEPPVQSRRVVQATAINNPCDMHQLDVTPSRCCLLLWSLAPGQFSMHQ